MDNIIKEKSLEEESLKIEETSYSINDCSTNIALNMVVDKKDRAYSDYDEEDDNEEEDDEDDDEEEDNNVKKAENVEVNAKKLDNIQVDNAKDDEDDHEEDRESEDSEGDSENEDSSDDNSEDDASEEDNSEDAASKEDNSEDAVENNVAKNDEDNDESATTDNNDEEKKVYSAWPGMSTEEKVHEVRKKLIMTAQMERLNDYVDARLTECGWKANLKNILRAEIKKNKNMTLENLFDCVKVKGKELVPDSLKEEMLGKIQEMYEAKVPDFTGC